MGWLVITHGVGPMRKYCLDPSRESSTACANPSSAPDEREGYVPNVVYSCGPMIHGPNLIFPYARSDSSSRIAIVPLADVCSRG